MADDKVVFVSRRPGLRLVMEPSVDQISPTGILTRTRGKVLEFDRGQLVIEPLAEDASFEKVEEREALLEFLREHRLNGDTIDGGFYELGGVPGQSEPTIPPASDAMVDVALLAAAQDVDGLNAALQMESQGYQRPEVLAALKSALATIVGTAEGAQDISHPDTVGEPDGEGGLSDQLSEDGP